MPGEREQVAEVIQNSRFSYNNLQQTLALGLLTLAKHDRAEDQFGPAYTALELASRDRFTTAEMDLFREQAGIMLAQFSSYLSIPKTRFWEDWCRPIIQGFISAFLYSVFLVVIVILAKLGGHDLIDIIREALKADRG